MQKAIETYINVLSEDFVPLDKIEFEIDKVKKAGLDKARKKQRIQWRKRNVRV